jgi:hypothetical protein
MEIILPKIKSVETPRKILATHFKFLNGELPIHGGWGYTQTDTCIINRNDNSIDPDLPFDWGEVEKFFVKNRTFEEMIISPPVGEKFTAIRWNLQKQNIAMTRGRVLDHLIFEITALREQDWEDPEKNGGPYFDLLVFEKKRQEKMVRLIREFWFDITSCHEPF